MPPGESNGGIVSGLLGLFEPLSEAAEPLFSRNSVFRIRKALRLKRDLHLNLDAVAIVIELLDRIDELERQIGQ